MKKIIEIEWLDSKGITGFWEYKGETKSLKPNKCYTIGYLQKDTKTYITIANSISKDQVLGRITIPKCIIKKIKEL